MAKSTFGERLKQIRTNKGYSVRKVALYGGISSSYYSQIENNKRNIPKPETLLKLAKGLHISHDEIFELAKFYTETLRSADKSFSFNQETEINNSGAIIQNLINSNTKVILPDDRRVYTNLSAESPTTPGDYVWVKVSDDTLTNEGIMTNDLAIVLIKSVDEPFSVEYGSKLIALNLNSKTVIRRVVQDYANNFLVFNSRERTEPIMIPKNKFSEFLVGLVVGIHREISN
ncbi:helix-turn-helix domain-containing protein [Lactiplantibacillus daoliensis]|uniref:Helix-turn-helix domain-containing protein n=1 Tax=Lactiplantibacillus daoliensis TaxID=2559916 RepID=A0ABW1UG95_9LACO|nr:LexA family transcriptional regulator [Lactiplantibacillus daoliensis]